MSNLKEEKESKKWFSSDSPPRMLWRLPKDILFGPMVPATVGYVKKNTKRSLQFISGIAGEVPGTPPKLSSVALKDRGVVLRLLEVSHSVSLMGKLRERALTSLSEDEKELGRKIAKAVLEAVRDDVRGDSDGKTLTTLRYAVENFQLWLEWLTDAAAGIRLGIKRDAVW